MGRYGAAGRQVWVREGSQSRSQKMDQIGRARERHAPAVLNEGQPERRTEVALASARRAEQQQIGAVFSQTSPAASAITWAFDSVGTL